MVVYLVLNCRFMIAAARVGEVVGLVNPTMTTIFGLVTSFLRWKQDKSTTQHHSSDLSMQPHTHRFAPELNIPVIKFKLASMSIVTVVSAVIPIKVVWMALSDAVCALFKVWSTGDAGFPYVTIPAYKQHELYDVLTLLTISMAIELRLCCRLGWSWRRCWMRVETRRPSCCRRECRQWWHQL